MRLMPPAVWQTISFCPECSGRSLSALSYPAILLVMVVVGSGCANFNEKRTINAFQEGLETGDIIALREKSTSRFHELALRHPESNDSLEQLKIPDGKFEVLHVEEVSKTEKKVTLGFGEDAKRKIQYHLVRNEETKKWEVDDIYLRQRSGTKAITMPVTDQMDVLLSSREFFEAWTGTDRQRALDQCGEDLSGQLAKLPPHVLSETISGMMGKSNSGSAFRPEVLISGDRAAVKINRPHGKLLLSMEKSGTDWTVKDLGLETSEKETNITSLLKTSQIMNKSIAFLDAWQRNDKQSLKKLTNEKFFTSGLAPASLSDLTLPDSMEIQGKVDVKLVDQSSDVIITGADKTIRMTILEVDTDKYEITDVTLYDRHQDQTLSLTAALTARPAATLFVEALRTRDRKMLQYSSTRNFHEKVWNRASEATLSVVPMPFTAFKSAQIRETQFLGNVTHIHMQSESDRFTVVLHDQGGRNVVDDVLVRPSAADASQNKSLKDHLTAIVPVYELASAIHHSHLDSTIRLVTDDFYDRVFSLTKTMPQNAYTFLNHVSAGTTGSLEVSQRKPGEAVDAKLHKASTIPGTGNSIIERYVADVEETIVTVKSDLGTMQVLLHREQGLLRVDDAIVVTPQNPVATRLKQTMRMDLVAARQQNMIQMASGEIRTLPKASKDGQPKPTPKPMVPQTLQDPEVTTAHYEERQQATPQQMIHTTAAQEPQACPVDEDCKECQADPLVADGQLKPHPDYLILQPVPTE
ncbi:hypothetical protein [Rubinisphaera margarita]|uniref:hypothetical protein n=1 Tax=Rubinisphaera margarita TaxID=2909586 RepID=UPI001EE7CCE0|nr:hypothetical protein [Rubinisphaera margarita]MCG6155787.1 hypothetical protein [Rubinisphaera margarita]